MKNEGKVEKIKKKEEVFKKKKGDEEDDSDQYLYQLEQYFSDTSIHSED